MSEQDLGKEVMSGGMPSKSEDGFLSPHTPTPWAITDRTQDGHLKVAGPAFSGLVACVGNGQSSSQDTFEANARFIVRACNAHDDLLAVVKLLKDRRCADFTLIEWAQIDAAIRKVTGQEP